MANGIFVVAKGRWVHWCDLPAATDSLLMVLLQGTIQTDDTFNNHTTLASLLGSHTEANFTNYSRKPITSGVVVTPNNTANLNNVDMPDLTWPSAGAISSGNNTITKAVLCYVPSSGAADSAIQPMLYWDVNSTTTGTDFLLQVNAGGLADQP